MSDKPQRTMPAWLGCIGGLSCATTLIYMFDVQSLATLDPDVATGHIVSVGTGPYGQGTPIFITQSQQIATALLALPGLVALIRWMIVRASTASKPKT